MKLKVLIGLLVMTLSFSCNQKGEVEGNEMNKETVETTENAALAANAIQLANYSDENWENGVGLSFNMLLVDYSKEKFELISKGTELTLPNGEKVPYIGYEMVDNFIHIQLGEAKATTYQASIEFPNEILIN